MEKGKVSEVKEVKNVENNVQEQLKKAKKKSIKRPLIVATFALLFLCIAFVFYRGNYLEILEIGKNYLGAYGTVVKYRAGIIIVSFVWLYLLLYTTNNRIKKGLKIFFNEEKKEVPKLPNKSISFIVAAVASVITSNIFLQKTILFINNTSFGRDDYIYGHDIGFYLFVQPFMKAVLLYVFITLLIVTLYSIAYYLIVFNKHFSSGVSSESLKSSIIKKQLFNNIRALVIIFAIFTFIGAEDLSSRTFLNVGEKELSYGLVGAGVTDVKIKVWGYRILSILMVVASFMVISAYNKNKNRKIFAWLFSVPVYMIVLIIAMIGYNKIFINTNKYEEEKMYINYNIKNTRVAYGINTDEVQLSDEGTITSEEINKYDDVVKNISITNKNLVMKQLNTNLTNKGYYKFTTSNAAVYNIDGEDSFVYVSPREIVTSDNSYTNSTYEYTHGNGVVITSASKTNSNGELINVQKELNQSDNVTNINNPRIYFGLETDKTVVTNSKNKNEFDYPEGEESKLNSYDGKAGLNLNSIDRMFLAMSKGDFKLAFTGNVNKDSKILTNRNIIQRAKKVMPYLMYDNSPYLVVTSSGKLVWVIDAYTTSKYYPYAQKSNVNGQEINYIRNSVKVLVDAYDGDIKFYITDRSDLVAMAYNKAFPEIFMGIDEEIPEEISSRFTYSEFLYKIQAEMVKRYHNTATDVMYRGKDIWDIAKYGAGVDATTKETTYVEPYYALVKTKDKEGFSIGLVLPYTLYGKQGISAYTVGTYENGKMVFKLYKYSSENNAYGPMQLDTQISQNESIAKEIEDLNVSGTKLTKNIVVVPVDDKCIYVESIYQEYLNESDSLPKLRKVVVASGNKMAIGNDLKSAITNLLSQSYNIEVENTDTVDGITDSIIKANNNLKKSTDSKDYEMIGKDLKELQGLIDKLEALKKQEEQKENKNASQEQTNQKSTNQKL